ncbi:aldehyde dehydrogenase family protein [Priestia aryabhattai]|nr:aldehyde dehydrogenase family protein [Priestia aryabhattai]
MTSYQELVKNQRSFFYSGKTKDVAFRIETLTKLKELIQNHEQDILDALKADLNKPEAEAKRAEVGLVLGEIEFTLKHLEEWAATKEVSTPATHEGAKSFIQPDPYGVALVIAPWNYPFQLAVTPLAGAIAAGNCAVLKPSELTPRTSSLLAALINENFPEEYLCVVEGEVETSTALLKENFNYIFFTGSTAVGKIVAKAAAEHLTPTTLELGGKSPTIVHSDANIEEAAVRIARGKFANAGQTCVAPDYILVQKNSKQALIEKLKEVIITSYGENISSDLDFSHIVSEKHFERLTNYLDNGKLVAGGNSDRSKLFIEPTILDEISFDDSVMQDEIFGPILPIIEYDELSEVIAAVRNRPNPLAVYVFTQDQRVQDYILNNLSFGGSAVNDTISHMTSHYLPFGGVGESGMGAYHGKASFDTFSHFKSVLIR